MRRFSITSTDTGHTPEAALREEVLKILGLRDKSNQVFLALKCMVGLPGRIKKDEVKKVMWMAEDLCNSFIGW